MDSQPLKIKLGNQQISVEHGTFELLLELILMAYLVNVESNLPNYHGFVISFI